MGMLIAIFITVLIAGAAIFYILSFHVPDRPSMAAYSAVAENSSTLRITSIAGNSIPQGSISLLLDNTRISSLMLQDSNTNSRWDPGEVLYSYGLNLTEAHRLTISSNANVIFETTVQYHGPAGNTTDGPMYASGVIATYYSDEGWTAPAAARISRSIQYADDSSMATYPSSESHWPTAELGKAQYFSVDFSGLLKIDAEADYTFYLTSDDGSYLTVDGAQVIDNGGLHSPLMRQATKHLTPGYHDIDVKMYQHAGQAVARLEYSSPSISRQFITQLYHVPADRPIASFTGTPRGAPVPLQVQFADNSLDALTWHWDFGDGSTSTDPNPLHVYTVAGTYNVSLAVTNGKGSDIKLIQGYIHAGGGAPGFVATYYSDEAWNNVTGSETISEIRLADVSGINAGYPSDRASWPVYMVGRDEQFSVICEGSLLVGTEADYTFYLTSDDGSYLTVDGAQVIDNGGLHSPAEKQGTVHLTPGYHDIETKMYEHTGQAVLRLEYSSPSIPRQYVNNVYHVPVSQPVANFTVSPSLAPAPATIMFHDTSKDAVAWHWDFGDGSTSTDPNPLHVYTVAGTYNVSLTVTNDLGSSIKTSSDCVTAGVGSQGFKAIYYSDEGWSMIGGNETLGEIKLADTAGVNSGYTSDKANWPRYIIGKDDQFSVRFTGSMSVATEADYTFYLTSDDGSYLTVDGAQVIDNGGLHSPAEKQGTVHLTPGYHDIETKMYEHTGLAVARLEYSSPTVTRRYVQDVCSA